MQSSLKKGAQKWRVDKLRTRFSEKEHLGSGLALTLVILLIGTLAKFRPVTAIVGFCIILLMVKPTVFYPFSVIWLNLSDILGRIMSRILLTVIFCLMVVPVGLARKIAGKDSLMLQSFKKSNKSVFKVRDHKFSKEDLLHPY